MPEKEGRTERGDVGDHHVRGSRRQRRHDRFVLRLGGPGEDLFDVKRDRLRAFQRRTFREPLAERLVVEISIGMHGHIRRTRGSHLFCE